MAGWVKIHRDILDHWIWQEKPYDKAHAFLDLILQANHSGKKVLVGNELEEISRGCLITSELKLMDRWGWSKNKVRSFLNLLENDNMIVRDTNRRRTAINIVNYGKYQVLETTCVPERDHIETTDEPRKVHKQELKNDKNEKKIIDTSSGTSADESTKYPYKEIVDYLNLKAGTSYRSTSKDTRKHIKARIDEGYSFDDFKVVIDKKVKEWGNPPEKGEKDMRTFIRPATLFSTNFEQYRGQISVVKQINPAGNNFQGRDYGDMSDLERMLIQ